MMRQSGKAIKAILIRTPFILKNPNAFFLQSFVFYSNLKNPKVVLQNTSFITFALCLSFFSYAKLYILQISVYTHTHFISVINCIIIWRFHKELGII